jgi:hypothetical protein
LKEIKKDLFDCIFDAGVEAICVTTNGEVDDSGEAAMWGGCAGVCRKRYPQSSFRLGKCLKNFNINVPYIIGALDDSYEYFEPNIKMVRNHDFKCLIFSFPTIDDLMSGAKLDLIENSARELKVLVDRFQLKNIVSARMGSGIGGLNWKDVKPVVEPYLDDRFTIVSFDDEE